MRYIMIGTIAALMCFYAYSDGDQNQQREDIQFNIDQQQDENYQNANMEEVVALGQKEVKMVVADDQKEQAKSVIEQIINRQQEGKVTQGIKDEDRIGTQRDVISNKFNKKSQKLGKQYNKSNEALSIPKWKNKRSSSQPTNTPKQQRVGIKTPKQQYNQPTQYQKQPYQRQAHKKATINQNPSSSPTPSSNTNANINANINANTNTNTNKKNSKVKEQKLKSQTKNNNQVVVTV